MTNVIIEGEQRREVIHEYGKTSLSKVLVENSPPILGNESQKVKESREISEEEMQWEIELK